MERAGAAASGVLLLDKPAGITSTRAVALCKRALGARKAGHTGTLDPFATGLLPLVFGEATKFSRFLIDARKSYQATLRLGERSATGDTESPAEASGLAVPGPAKIDEVLGSFVGAGRQIPPMHSAVHVKGKRLYQYARAGTDVAREPRPIHVFELRREAFDGRDLVVSVSCSKGTYIRVLAADLGEAFGCGAYLVSLRRTGVGPFSVDEAVALEELQRGAPAEGAARLLPATVLVSDLEAVRLERDNARRFMDGQRIEAAQGRAGEVAVFDDRGEFVGVASRVEDGTLVPLRLMATEPKSPDFA